MPLSLGWADVFKIHTLNIQRLRPHFSKTTAMQHWSRTKRAKKLCGHLHRLRGHFI